MLSDAEKMLVTAGVCGHLSQPEKAELRVLLDDNAEAKKLYKALCKDRDRLAALPKAPAPESVWANVMARVQSGPIVVPPKLPAGKGAGWLPYAVAALLLVAAGGAVYLAVADRTQRHDVAVKTPPAPLPDPSAAFVAAADGVANTKVPEIVGPPKPDTVVAKATPRIAESAPAPRSVIRRDPFTAAVPNPVVFATVDARLPVLFPVADAADAELGRKVKAEFAAGHALRLDLFAKDTHRAADLFRTAVGAGGTTLLVDAVTQELLKRKQRLAWAVYSETLTSKDVLEILKRLAAADAKNPAADIWTSGHLSAASSTDAKEAKDLFGIDTTTWKKAKATGPVPAPTEPVSAGTADQIAAKLAKPSAATAIMTTFLPTSLRINPAASPQIKKYHDDKPAKKDGAVPLVIVIRPGN
jgi:hypothetical protein